MVRKVLKSNSSHVSGHIIKCTSAYHILSGQDTYRKGSFEDRLATLESHIPWNERKSFMSMADNDKHEVTHRHAAYISRAYSQKSHVKRTKNQDALRQPCREVVDSQMHIQDFDDYGQYRRALTAGSSKRQQELAAAFTLNSVQNSYVNKSNDTSITIPEQICWVKE